MIAKVCKGKKKNTGKLVILLLSETKNLAMRLKVENTLN